MAKFFVVGDVTVDQMYFISEFPEVGGEVSATRAIMEPGGAGGTIATALGRLGNEVLLASRVGTGPFASLALSRVLEAGVDTRLVQHDKDVQTSSVTLLITPNTERTMISAGGASRNLDATDLKTADIASCDALVMSAYSLMGGMQREYAVRALEAAKKARLTTFIDMGSGAVNAMRNSLISLVREVDYLLMNQRELFTLTGQASISDAVMGLAEHGIKRVIVKVGDMGSIVITPELTELVEAFGVDGVMDSTGAGDYYTAAFAHGIMQGYDLHYAARLGNIAGALNVTVVGAQKYHLDAGAVERHAKSMTAKPAGF
ncbi:MAG: carbohydrate kinase family protein [Deinococcota bacterium]|jgi:ribokinase|nr:carbohydrate kinase family protein [Deinococcota bacterium]